MAGHETIIKAAEKLQGQFTSATCSIAQRAAIAALSENLAPTKEMVQAFTERRKIITSLAAGIPGFRSSMPEGAFYIFPDLSDFFGKTAADGTVVSNADDLAMYLLNKAHVSTVTGAAFGEPDCIRLSFANSIPNIEKAMQRIKEALAALK